MKTVGVRALKARVSEIVEEVQATGERYQVTRRGVAVAMIVPTPAAVGTATPESVEHDLAVWAEMDKLAAEIGRRWPPGVSATEALAASRR